MACLLPLLSSHLPAGEIAEEMSLSQKIIKSQAFSVYRKLGAGSRREAVSRGRELGLWAG
jgi:LuxR family transcriptional regulator, maltose regulon positive regulatory protein